MNIIITAGQYSGRRLRTYTLSTDGCYVQVKIGQEIVEFKLGHDCKWAD